VKEEFRTPAGVDTGPPAKTKDTASRARNGVAAEKGRCLPSREEGESDGSRANC
jgi:hypothetical protein